MGKTGLTRRELLLVTLSAVLFGFSITLATISGDRIKDLRDRLAIYEGAEDESLTLAAYNRFQYNGRYKPSYNEVRDWVRWIREFDQVLKDPIFYVAIIDLESGGNPTLYLEHDGHTRGLGCVSYAASKDIIYAHDLPIKAAGTALWNPRYNIFAMIKCIERAYANAPRGADPRHYALFAYNAGEGKAKKIWEAERRVPTSYYKKHKLRVEMFSRKTKGEGE